MYYSFSNADIGSAITAAKEYVDSRRGSRSDKTKALLWLEETLLIYKDKLGEDAGFDLQLGSALGRSKIELTVAGEQLDPFSVTEEAEQRITLMRSFLTALDQRPVWRYTHARNRVTFSLPRARMSGLRALLIAVISAIILGFLMRLAPEGVRTTVQAGIIQPALNMFLGFLNAVAAPMIFLSVVWGIYSMGDAATFSKVGSKVCGSFLLVLTVLTAVLIFVLLPFFSFASSESAGLGGLGEIYAMLLDIVPDNLFSPFTQGNTLQILFLAVIIGITTVIVGDKAQGLTSILEQLNTVVQAIMGSTGRLVPFFIFGSLFNIVSTSDLSALGVCGRFFATTIAACVFLLIVHTVLTCIKLKISPVLLWKKALPAFTVALTTASSSAAFSSNLDSAVKGFGISERLANFGVPMGQILYMPGVSAVFLCAAMSTAADAGTGVSLFWFVSAAVTCILLSVATPTVAGGTAASFAVLFIQLGLPTEQLAMILALNTLLDFFHTATNLFSDQCVLLLIADKLELIDREVLKSEDGKG